jgi:hypothetical protein
MLLHKIRVSESTKTASKRPCSSLVFVKESGQPVIHIAGFFSEGHSLSRIWYPCRNRCRPCLFHQCLIRALSAVKLDLWFLKVRVQNSPRLLCLQDFQQLFLTSCILHFIFCSTAAVHIRFFWSSRICGRREMASSG